MSYREEKSKKRLSRTSESDEYTDSEYACISSAMNILVYANNTEKRLREKLSRKGYCSDDIDTALEYVKGKGYINEKSQVIDAAVMLATTKLYGKKRIAVELYKKGFKREDIAQIDYDELEIDFIAGCAALICRACKLDDDEKREFVPDNKIMGSLIRYGYTVSEIREAVRLLHET